MAQEQDLVAALVTRLAAVYDAALTGRASLRDDSGAQIVRQKQQSLSQLAEDIAALSSSSQRILPLHYAVHLVGPDFPESERNRWFVYRLFESDNGVQLQDQLRATYPFATIVPANMPISVGTASNAALNGLDQDSDDASDGDDDADADADADADGVPPSSPKPPPPPLPARSPPFAHHPSPPRGKPPAATSRPKNLPRPVNGASRGAYQGGAEELQRPTLYKGSFVFMGTGAHGLPRRCRVQTVSDPKLDDTLESLPEAKSRRSSYTSAPQGHAAVSSLSAGLKPYSTRNKFSAVVRLDDADLTGDHAVPAVNHVYVYPAVCLMPNSLVISSLSAFDNGRGSGSAADPLAKGGVLSPTAGTAEPPDAGPKAGKAKQDQSHNPLSDLPGATPSSTFRVWAVRSTSHLLQRTSAAGGFRSAAAPISVDHPLCELGPCISRKFDFNNPVDDLLLRPKDSPLVAIDLQLMHDADVSLPEVATSSSLSWPVRHPWITRRCPVACASIEPIGIADACVQWQEWAVKLLANRLRWCYAITILSENPQDAALLWPATRRRGRSSFALSAQDTNYGVFGVGSGPGGPASGYIGIGSGGLYLRKLAPPVAMLTGPRATYALHEPQDNAIGTPGPALDASFPIRASGFAASEALQKAKGRPMSVSFASASGSGMSGQQAGAGNRLSLAKTAPYRRLVRSERLPRGLTRGAPRRRRGYTIDNIFSDALVSLGPDDAFSTIDVAAKDIPLPLPRLVEMDPSSQPFYLDPGQSSPLADDVGVVDVGDQDIPAEDLVTASAAALVVFAGAIELVHPQLSYACGTRTVRQLIDDYKELKVKFMTRQRTEMKRAYIKLEKECHETGRPVPPKPDFDSIISRQPHWAIVRVERGSQILLQLLKEATDKHKLLAIMESSSGSTAPAPSMFGGRRMSSTVGGRSGRSPPPADGPTTRHMTLEACLHGAFEGLIV